MSEKHTSKRKYRYIRLSVIAILILICPLSCLCNVIWISRGKIIGEFIQDKTKYPNAEVVYIGSRVVGSSDLGDRAYIMWTQDPIDAVREHYEQHFPPFEDTTFQDSLQFEMSSLRRCYVRICAEIRIADATQSDREWMLIDNMYANNPFGIIANLPDDGTVIVLNHYIIAP